MGWEDYALVAAGCMALICIVLGLIETLIWGRWERAQRAAYVAGLEDDYRDAACEVRSLRLQISEMRGNYGHQREQAYCQGWDDGEAEGHKDGYDHGFSVGHGMGYDEGHADGFTEGYIGGYTEGRDGEHKYWTERGADECDPFGMDRPTGVYDEPDNGVPSVVAAINAAIAEGPTEA